MRRRKISALIRLMGMLLYLGGLGTLGVWGSAPLGPPGVVATYALDADPQQRPAYERERKLTVRHMQLKLGPVAPVAGWAH